MQQNLTSGSVFQNVVRFSLPYLLSYFLQTLYGMADLFIVGQFEPVAATTAVSIGSQVMHMLTVMLVGLAMGTTVTIAQAVGAGDKKSRPGGRQYRDALRRDFRPADGRFTFAGAAHHSRHVHARRSCFRHRAVPHHLLSRHSVHHGL